jgi:probable HAF family extracellular repeat protein
MRRLTTTIGMCLSVLLAAGTVGAGSADAAVTPRYEVAAVIGTASFAGAVGRAVNESGTVVGWIGSPFHAFRWSAADGLVDLPGLPGDTYSTATDVNEAGVVVGHSGYETIEPPMHAVRWIDDVPQDLGALEAHGNSEAEGVNDAGVVVGRATVGSSNHAFVWTAAGGMTDITPTAQNAVAYDINESGVVAGYADGRAFIWHDGTTTQLGVPAGFATSYAYTVNDSGQVGGHATTASGNASQFGRWTSATGWQVLGGVGETNVAYGMNGAGTLVGKGRPYAGLERGFVYLDGVGAYALEDALSTTEWAVTGAYDVNDAGQIVALGSNRITGNRATLLLQPVTRPAAHVASNRVKLVSQPPLTKATATVAVADAGGAALAGATVSGQWSVNGVPSGAKVSATTDAAGVARFQHKLRDVPSGASVAFCVSNVVASGYSYDPSGSTCGQAPAS